MEQFKPTGSQETSKIYSKFNQALDSVRAGVKYGRTMWTYSASEQVIEISTAGVLAMRANRSRSAEQISHLELSNVNVNGHVSSSPLGGVQETTLNVPPEICKMIMNFTFEDIFGPRKVHPESDSPLTESFLALDKQLYNQYRKIYWSENTWIIGHGPVSDSMRFMTLVPYDTSTTEFSKQNPNEAALKIQRVEICFSTKDLRRPHTTNEVRSSPSVNGFDLLEEYDCDSKSLTADLMQLWQDKFDRIAFLDLEYLRLDYTEAYAPDGEFLGLAAVQRFLPFVFRVPAELIVVAPTKVLEDEIREVLLELNKKPAVSTGSLVEESE